MIIINDLTSLYALEAYVRSLPSTEGKAVHIMTLSTSGEYLRAGTGRSGYEMRLHVWSVAGRTQAFNVRS